MGLGRSTLPFDTEEGKRGVVVSESLMQQGLSLLLRSLGKEFGTRGLSCS